jgi:hypothetical protein
MSRTGLLIAFRFGLPRSMYVEADAHTLIGGQ